MSSGRIASARKGLILMRLNLARMLGTLALAFVWLLQIGTASAQLDPPDRRCSDLMACESGEINHAYTVQYQSGCGANCSISYWVRDRDDGRVLLSVTGVPSATIGVRGFDRDARPDVRVIAPRYGPTDLRCCPGAIVDTRYAWNADGATLIIADERIIPIQEANLDALHAELRDHGYILYFDDRP
jgi:hypothetical protein